MRFYQCDLMENPWKTIATYAAASQSSSSMPLLANLNAPAFPLQHTHILLHDAGVKQF